MRTPPMAAAAPRDLRLSDFLWLSADKVRIATLETTLNHRKHSKLAEMSGFQPPPARSATSGADAPTQRTRGACGVPHSDGAGPQVMLGAEEPDFTKLDVSVLRVRDCGAGDPPAGAGQPGGHVGPAAGLQMLLRVPRAGGNFAVCRLPEPDKAGLVVADPPAEDDGVVPPPDHGLSAVRCGRDGYEVTWRDPLCPRPGEGTRESDCGQLSRPQDLTGVFLDVQNDSAAEPRGSRRLICRSSHAPSVSRRIAGGHAVTPRPNTPRPNTLRPVAPRPMTARLTTQRLSNRRQILVA